MNISQPKLIVAAVTIVTGAATWSLIRQTGTDGTVDVVTSPAPDDIAELEHDHDHDSPPGQSTSDTTTASGAGSQIGQPVSDPPDVTWVETPWMTQREGDVQFEDAVHIENDQHLNQYSIIYEGDETDLTTVLDELSAQYPGGPIDDQVWVFGNEDGSLQIGVTYNAGTIAVMQTLVTSP